jgi:hypothetical protein
MRKHPWKVYPHSQISFVKVNVFGHQCNGFDIAKARSAIIQRQLLQQQLRLLRVLRQQP